jgi:hypothetical protein
MRLDEAPRPRPCRTHSKERREMAKSRDKGAKDKKTKKPKKEKKV